MGILFLTVKQERCSDLLLWFAAWLLPPLRLRPKLMLTTATATALDTDSATPDSATPDSATPDSATPDSATDTDSSTARGRLRPSPRLRLMPSTDTELTPTPLASATLVLDTPTARGRPRLSPRLMLTTLTDTVSATPDSATPDSATLDSATLVSATLVLATDTDSATATVWELTTVLTLDKFVQLRAAEAQHSLYRQFSFTWSRTPCTVRKERILFSLIVW